MKQCTICEIAVKFSSVESLYITRNVAFSIFKNIKNRAGRSGFTFYTKIFTVIYKNARCISIIIKVCVHTTNNVIAKLFFIIFGHFCEFLMRPVSLICKIFVDLIVSRNNRYIRVRRINLDNVDNLSTSTAGIIEYHFRLNSSTWNEYVIFFRDYIVIAVSSECFAIVNNIGFFPIWD